MDEEPTAINIANGYGNYVLGDVNSLPWDRWERTLGILSTPTKAKNNHTIKFGGNFRKNSDKLLETQDNQGPRGGFSFSGAQTGADGHTAANSGTPTRSPPSCLIYPAAWRATSRCSMTSGRSTGRGYSFVQEQRQVSRPDDR